MALEFNDQKSVTRVTLSTAKYVWGTLKQTYWKVSDATQVYEIRIQAISTKQSNRIVTEYVNELRRLWQELDHYRQIEIKCIDDVTTLKEVVDCHRIYIFLAGINNEFDQVGVQILSKEKLHHLMKLYRLSLLKKIEEW